MRGREGRLKAMNFRWFILNSKKIMMRLRHKKPINSYKVPGNHESSVSLSLIKSMQDEEFEKYQSFPRRQKLVKPKPPSEESKKYAEILSDFVRAVNLSTPWINLDYRKKGGSPGHQEGACS